MNHYIDAKCFEDFKKNQDQLINVLNHRVTKITIDLSWIKKYLGIIAGLIVAIFLTNLGVVLFKT